MITVLRDSELEEVVGGLMTKLHSSGGGLVAEVKLLTFVFTVAGIPKRIQEKIFVEIFVDLRGLSSGPRGLQLQAPA